MKAIIDYENSKIKLDPAAIKAIRFCYGLPTDLRVKPYHDKEVDRLFINWLDSNALNIFGTELTTYQNADINSEKETAYNRMLKSVLIQVYN